MRHEVDIRLVGICMVYAFVEAFFFLNNHVYIIRIPSENYITHISQRNCNQPENQNKKITPNNYF